MTGTLLRSATLTPEVLARALESRDARFDGVFFVGITSTNIYCRPICPARVSYPNRRRFFDTAAAAEGAGYRPCLRCRPELAPGLAPSDAVSALARAAVLRIAGGALNGSGVSALARQLSVSERHLRRALEREIGVSPVDLAQTHRLLLAKQLLGETALPVTRIAYASGFQSLRRFNSVFRERYGLNPSAVRRRVLASSGAPAGSDERREEQPAADLVHLSLAYRAPLAWPALLRTIDRDALPGVEFIERGRYARSVSLEGHRGVVVVSDAAVPRVRASFSARTHLDVAVSPALLPALMPLLARLRQLFDLDAEPLVVDAHLAAAGLKQNVRRTPGLRSPGAFDGFEIALAAILSDAARPRAAAPLLSQVVTTLGEPLETEWPEITTISPSAARVAEAGAARLKSLGVAPRAAEAICVLARAVAVGELLLDPSADAETTRQALLEIDGVSDRIAHTIVTRALHWPDAFPQADAALRRAAHAASSRALLERAEQWRPWRAYAALHLQLSAERRLNNSHTRQDP